MAKLPPEKLKTGMKLIKPVMNKAGMVLLGEGTELNETWIRRIQDMDIANVFVEGSETERPPREEVLAQLDARFRYVENKPYMSLIKSVLKQHIESLYE